jgi:peptidyl-prolyl cis-trans isomerase D
VELPAGADILPGIFASQVGVENDPVQAGGGFVWFELAAVTPARDRTMEDVKDRLAARWREDEIAARLKAKAAEMVDKLKSGTPMPEVAAAGKLKVETAKDVRRRGTDTLSQDAVAAVFKTPKGAAAAAEGKQPGEQVVFVVSDVSTPAFDANSAESKRISDQLRNAMADELLTQYIARIEADLGTTINRTALNQAILGSSGQ